jgi:hypothetical protein
MNQALYAHMNNKRKMEKKNKQTGVLYFCLGPVLDHDPPTYACHIAGITNVSHHAQLVD